MSDPSIGLVSVSDIRHDEPEVTAMTAPPPYTAVPEHTEYESLLELHERQEITAVQRTPATNADIDLEAARPSPEATPAPAPAPKPPLTAEQLRALRVRPMDNIRALSLCFLLLQNAAIQAVSTHPQAAVLHEIAPKMLAFINLFVGMTRLLVVPFLFFMSGFSSQFAMHVHDRSPVYFVIRKTWRTALTVIFYQGAAHLSKRFNPLPLGEDTTTVPYYASREGVDALLNGPTAYVLAILALDYIYAIIRCIVLITYGGTSSTHFINTANRYKYVKNTLFLSVELYALFFSMAVGRFGPPNARVQRYMYTLNSAEIHFPLLYIIAYVAGVKFIGYYKFLLAARPAFKKRITGLGVGITLFIRILISFLGLYLIYRNYPKTMPEFLDVRRKPTLALVPRDMLDQDIPEEGLNLVYAIWVGYTLLVVPEAFVAAFWSIRSLAMPWGRFSRHAHIQVYLQLLFVVGNKASLFESLFARWVFLGGSTMLCAYYLGVVGVMVGDLMKRGWTAMRGGPHTSVEAEPEEGVIAL